MSALSELMDPKRVKIGLQAKDKEGVLRELVELLDIPEENKEILLEALKRREELGSTGIGRGIAIPHSRSTVVDNLYLVIGVSKEGVDFDAVDGKPVHIFFLLVAPPNDPGSRYLIYLGRVAQLAKKIVENNVDYLSVESPEELIELLSSLEKE